MTAPTGIIEDLHARFSEIVLRDVEYPSVIPTTIEQVSELIHWCRERAWKVLPVGRGHSFSEQHHVPTGVLTVVSTGRRGMSEPSSRDLAIDVEAGVPAKTVAEVVEGAGFILERWPREYPGTVGGLFCGTRGPELRALVLGVQMVDGTGRVLRFGGRIRKDVSGFDAAGTLIGSRGTIGWLDRVCLRLRPGVSAPAERVSLPGSTAPAPFAGLSKRVARAYDPYDVFVKHER